MVRARSLPNVLPSSARFPCPPAAAVGADHARIGYLDGLRGLAIALVMAWHYTCAPHARYLPYGATLRGVPIIADGWIGVYLFFLISGYVVSLSLERSSGLGDFLWRRWLRLFPAMRSVPGWSSPFRRSTTPTCREAAARRTT